MLLRIILLIGLGLTGIAYAPTTAWGQPASLPAELPAWLRLDLGPAEKPLLADAADGRLDDHDLLAAALVADGISNPVTQDRYRRQFEGWIAELLPTIAGQTGTTARTELVFQFLQRHVLRGSYQESSSSLVELFERGQYNCVSSTIIFCCLAEHLQIDVRAAEAPGHVIARLIEGENHVDIETTCRDWRRAAKLDTARPGEAFRGLSKLGLLALAYYNRGVDALEKRDFDAALAENVKALRLDPASRTARSNLLAALNNGALAVSDQGRHEAALEQLLFARSIDPEFEPAAKNLQVVRRRQVIGLCDRHEFRRASTILAEARQENPKDAELQAFEAEVLNREGLRLLESDRVEEAIDWYRQALANRPSDGLLNDNLRVAVMSWADEAFRRHDYAAAISRTEYASRPGQLDTARLNNLRYGYQQWARRLRASGRDAEAARVARQAAEDPFLAWPTEAQVVRPVPAGPSDLTPAQG